MFRANLASETRVENKRFIRRYQQEAIEREMEEKLQEAEKQRIFREKQKEQEEKLAKVIWIYIPSLLKPFDVAAFTYQRLGGVGYPGINSLEPSQHRSIDSSSCVCSLLLHGYVILSLKALVDSPTMIMSNQSYTT